MDIVHILGIMSLLIPLFATIILHLHNEGFSERHHSHHDTYLVSYSLTWTLLLAMIVMGFLGILIGWLCYIGVFAGNPIVVMGFFDTYLLGSFVCWIFLVRYKVVTYDTYMETTPFIGPSTRVAYADITSMQWTPSLILHDRRSIRIFVGRRQRALLWGGLDLDQILIRINRFDKLEEYVV